MAISHWFRQRGWQLLHPDARPPLRQEVATRRRSPAPWSQGATALALGAGLSVASGCGPSFIDDPPMLDICQAPDGVVDGLAPVVLKTKPFAPREMVRNVAHRGSSAHGLAESNGRLFAVDTDNGAVAVLDAKTMALKTTIPVGARPDNIVIGADGIAFVGVRHSGTVARLDTNTLQVTAQFPVGVEPIGLALSPDGKLLFVGLAGESRVAVLNTLDGKEIDSIETSASPRSITAVALAAVQGKVQLAISHTHGPATLVQYDPAKGSAAVPHNVLLRSSNPAMRNEGSQLKQWRAISSTVSPETGDALVAHVLVSPGDESTVLNNAFMPQGIDKAGNTSSGGYGSSGPSCTETTPIRPVEVAVTPVGTANTPMVLEFAIADPETGRNFLARFDQPHDIVHHDKATIAFVAAMGSDNILVLNTALGDPMAYPIAEIRVGQAPRALTLSADGQTLYVLNAHSFTVGEVDLQPLLQTVVKAYPGAGKQPPQLMDGPLTLLTKREAVFGKDTLPEAARLGRRLFTFSGNDKISEAGRFACASCHLEGDEDKQTWFVADGPRQTPALAGRLQGTGPFNWAGTEDHLQTNMDRTIERMGGVGLDAKELDSLEQFLLFGLVPPPNPHLAATGLTEQQERGRKLFEDPTVGCASCHGGDTTTDGKVWDVGTATKVELTVREFQGGLVNGKPDVRFNTPSLRGLFHTAPYLHDGSAATLSEVLSRTSGKMGNTSHLTKAQKSDLIAYLLTL